MTVTSAPKVYVWSYENYSCQSKRCLTQKKNVTEASDFYRQFWLHFKNWKLSQGVSKPMSNCPRQVGIWFRQVNVWHDLSVGQARFWLSINTGIKLMKTVRVQIEPKWNFSNDHKNHKYHTKDWAVGGWWHAAHTEWCRITTIQTDEKKTQGESSDTLYCQQYFLAKHFWVSHYQIFSDGCPKDKWNT